MSYDVSKIDQPDNLDKGQENGSCNRSACQAPNARWYNHGSLAWYCDRCRHDIEFDSFNLRNWREHHQPECGHPMFETRDMFEARGVTDEHTITAPARPRADERPVKKVSKKRLFRV